MVAERQSGGASQAWFYEGESAIAFPPVSDSKHSYAAETIPQLINQAVRHVPDLRRRIIQDRKKILFPVVEELPIFHLFARDHWGTLHYDPETGVATLIDSRPWFPSWPSVPELAL